MNNKIELKKIFKNLCLNFHEYAKKNPETNINDIFFDNWFEKTSLKDIVDKFSFILDKTNKIEKFYDKKGNASHYSAKRLNSIVKFERVYGTLAVMTFCEITADRYRERVGKKDNQSIEQEVLKMNWYENAANYYFQKMNTKDEIIVDNYKKENLPWEEK